MEISNCTKNWKRILEIFVSLVFSILFFSSGVFASNVSPEISHGFFEITSTGTQQISGIEFEPDVIKFEITSTNENFNTQTLNPGRKFGWGHGFANVKSGDIDEIALTVASGSASPNGMAAASSNKGSIFQVLTTNDGDGITGWINASVISVDSDGFTINVTSADDSQFVTYTAYKFEEDVKIDIGYFNTSTTTGLDFVETGFEPTFLNVITQPHRSISDINAIIQDPDGDNGWGHGYASQRRGVIDQISMAVSMHSENIDYHSWGSSDDHILYTLEMKPKGSTITGRIKASLESFDNTGFTLNYDEVAGGQIAIYMAIGTKFESEVGHVQTPTSLSIQEIDTDIRLDTISFISSNTIPTINSEAFVDASHHGWMLGVADMNTQRSMGFSSNSDSVNGHSSGSSSQYAMNLLYTDNDGNVLGRDTAELIEINPRSFELDWKNIVTSSTPGVIYDRVLLGYYGFASELNFAPNNEQVNFTNSLVYINETNFVNATITDKNGNSTISNVTASIEGPNSTNYNLSLVPEIENYNLTSVNVENEEKNYTAISDGDTIGESGKIDLRNRETKVIEFTQNYDKTPVIIAIASTQNNDNSPFIPVIYSINTTHANISLCRDDGAVTCDNSYNLETVSYMIFDIDKSNAYPWIEVGKINITTNGNTNAISFDKTFSNSPYMFGLPQTYNINSVVTNGIGAMSWFPTISTTGANIVGCDHPGIANSCAGTAVEEFGYVAIDVVNHNLTKFDFGSETISNSQWTSIIYSEIFNEPVISVMVNSETGPEDPAYPWARDVTTTGADIRYCEADAPNYCDTHNGEVTRWILFENGPIGIGNGGDDIEKNITITTYNNIFLEDVFNITSLLIKLDVNDFDRLGSLERGNNDPDLEIELNSDSGWNSVGKLEITGVGTYEVNVTNRTILNSWNFITNRDLRINGVYFDYFNSTHVDSIFYNNLEIDVNYQKYTGKWSSLFENTSVCGSYNLTSLLSVDNTGLFNQTNYTKINFIVPCGPVINLILPIDDTKILSNGGINLTWEVLSPETTLSCDLYLNSIYNQTVSCNSLMNTSLNINLDSGYYNWTVNVTDSNNLSSIAQEENFLIILNYSSSIGKAITSIGEDLFFVDIEIVNRINSSEDIVVYDFVDEKFNAGSFNPFFDSSTLVSGLYNGTIYNWDLLVSPSTTNNLNYSITDSGSGYFWRRNFIVGLE